MAKSKDAFRRTRATRSPLSRTIKAAKSKFEAAHRAGMQAIANHDFEALGAAIDAEREVIEWQRGRIEGLGAPLKSVGRRRAKR